ncbi:hypothetical protein RFI_33521, partial [Reticulomyxa filosa]
THTYRVVLGTSLGRLFVITLMTDQNRHEDFASALHPSSSGSHDKQKKKDKSGVPYSLDILLSTSNEGEDASSTLNRSWFSSFFDVLSPFLVGADDVDTVITNPQRTTSFDQSLFKVLLQSGVKGNRNLQVQSMCFGLNFLDSQLVLYVLRKHSIDCITFSNSSHQVLFQKKNLYTYIYVNIYIPIKLYYIHDI